MSRAMEKLGREVSNTWTIGSAVVAGDQFEPFSISLLQRRFQNALARAGSAVIERERLAGRNWSNIESFLAATDDDADHIRRSNHLKLTAWQNTKGALLEALCLLAVLARHRPVGTPPPVDLFARVGPLAMSDGSAPQYLWTRPNLPSAQSGLRAAPDIVLTTTPEVPTAANTLSITECKCRRVLSASEIRSEFGKAYDLAAPSYTVLSYYSQPDRIREAASALGLAFEVFQLHSRKRADYLLGTRDLGLDLAGLLARSRGERAFLAMLEGKRNEVQTKLIGGG
ncbi:hypothetical protein ACFL6M_04385 [Candidatus Eisenbacteria bacterium]|uniref:Restriction endonuclease n=1 Tax=Eiseniibacteriota bacterium TaxID=2212470 RepID=A0ABV6YKH9_UNCEI